MTIQELFSSIEVEDQRSFKFLADAMQKSKAKGFDYLNFREAVANLQAEGLEEAVAFRYAFTTAKTMGISKAQLAKSLKQYVAILDREKSSFEAALNKRTAERVTKRESDIAKLKKSMEVARTKIEQLKAQVAKAEERIVAERKQIEVDQSQLDDRRSGFEGAHSALKEVITEDIQRIDSLLL